MPGLLQDQLGIPNEEQVGAFSDEDIMTMDPNTGGQVAPAPGAQINFDVDRNPQDMQFMTDAAAYAPMLKAMDEGQRKEQWPGIAEKLGQVSPKAQKFLDPSIPPSDEDLDAIIGKLPAAAEKPKEEEKAVDIIDKDFDMNMAEEDFLVEATEVSQRYWGKRSEREKEKQRVIDKYAKDGLIAEYDADGNIVVVGRVKGLDKYKGKEDSTKGNEGYIGKLRICQNNLPAIQNMLFDPETFELNEKTIRNMKYDQYGKLGGGWIASKDGKMLNTMMRQCIYAVSRIESKARIEGGEARIIGRDFEPDLSDPPEVVAAKYLMLKAQVHETLSLYEPSKVGKGGKYAEGLKKEYDPQAAQILMGRQEEWVKKAQEIHPNVSTSTLKRAYIKKLLTDPHAPKELAKELNRSK